MGYYIEAVLGKMMVMYLDFRKNTVPMHVCYQTVHLAHKNTFTYLKEKRIENNLSDEQYSQSNTMCFPLSFKLCSFSKLHYRIAWKLFFIFYSKAPQYFLQYMHHCSTKSYLKVILIWSEVGWRQTEVPWFCFSNILISFRWYSTGI